MTAIGNCLFIAWSIMICGCDCEKLSYSHTKHNENYKEIMNEKWKDTHLL